MTTVSNQNSLNPLARTKGGCATTNTAGRTSNRNNTADASSPKEDDYDGMMPLMGIREDEEIASVEADGAGANDTAGGGTSNSGSVEKKILTAALVTSMADAGARSGHTHDVTPTTSEASSFSSVESTDSSMNQSSGSAAPAGGGGVAPSNGAVTSNSTVTAAANSRTIYPRASKAAATTKVTTALTCKKPSPKAKRRLDGECCTLFCNGSNVVFCKVTSGAQFLMHFSSFIPAIVPNDTYSQARTKSPK